MERLIRWLRGYVRVSFSGKQTMRFLNLCRNHGIIWWNVIPGQGNILVSDFFRLRPLLRKTRTRIHVERRIGARFVLARLLHHPSLVLAALLMASFLYIPTLFIWNIQVQAGTYYTEEWVKEVLSEEGIVPGIPRSKIDCQKVEDLLRKHFPLICWSSVSKSGSCLMISFKESETDGVTGKESGEVEQKKPSSLIAACDARVTGIFTRAGTPMVKKGDEVHKGDVLVFGGVLYHSDEGVVATAAGVYADADVDLEYELAYKDQFSIKIEERTPKGEKTKKYGIQCFGRTIWQPFTEYEKEVEYVTDAWEVLPENAWCGPVTILTRQEQGYTVQWKKQTKTEAKKVAKQRSSRYFQKLEEKGVSILENHVTIEIVGFECKVSGRLKVRERAQGRTRVTSEELLSKLGAYGYEEE